MKQRSLFSAARSGVFLGLILWLSGKTLAKSSSSSPASKSSWLRPMSFVSPSTTSKDIPTTTKAPPPNSKRAWIQKQWQSLVKGNAPRGPNHIHQFLYWFTAADAVHSVLQNEYSEILGFLSPTTSLMATTRYGNRMVPSVYSKLFYFARLRPRLLYAVGSLLRALQLCTPLGRILDPSIGVGAGINLCAIVAGSQWVQPVILGWATTKYMWKWLGAQRVDRAFVPVTLSIHEWEQPKKSKKNKGGKDEQQQQKE